jgi:hypothetical protein
MVNTGDCLLQIGRFDQAVAMLAEGIGQFNESFVRDRQIYITHLAGTLARSGKQRALDVAAGLGMESIDLTESLDSNNGLGRMRLLGSSTESGDGVTKMADSVGRSGLLFSP